MRVPTGSNSCKRIALPGTTGLSAKLWELATRATGSHSLAKRTIISVVPTSCTLIHNAIEASRLPTYAFERQHVLILSGPSRNIHSSRPPVFPRFQEHCYGADVYVHKLIVLFSIDDPHAS
jgi:hypothetical protein